MLILGGWGDQMLLLRELDNKCSSARTHHCIYVLPCFTSETRSQRVPQHLRGGKSGSFQTAKQLCRR